MITVTEDWLLRAEAVCMACGGHCCNEAHPPISRERYSTLRAAGIPEAAFEHKEGYFRLRARKDNTCTLMVDHKCTCHAVKPETCRAGPFTFDVEGNRIRIFLKDASICPIVPLLREEPAAYQAQYDRAVENITRLVAGLSDAEIEAINRIDEPETELVADIPVGHRCT